MVFVKALLPTKVTQNQRNKNFDLIPLNSVSRTVTRLLLVCQSIQFLILLVLREIHFSLKPVCVKTLSN